MFTPQLIIFMDKNGNFHAELPGLNGARQKIHLGEDFRKRNPEITTALLDANAALVARQEKIEEDLAQKQAAKSQAEKLAEIAVEREARFDAWLNTLPKDRQRVEIQKREDRRTRAQAAELKRARSIWSHNAEHHGIDFANKITPDKNRRPRRKVISISADGTRKEISPRTEVQTINKKKIDTALLLDL